MTLLKPDIQEAFVEFLYCRSRWRTAAAGPEVNNDEDPTGMGLDWSGWRSLRNLLVVGAKSSSQPLALGESQTSVTLSIVNNHMANNTGLSTNNSSPHPSSCGGETIRASKDTPVDGVLVPTVTDIDYASPLGETSISSTNHEDADVWTDQDLTEGDRSNESGQSEKVHPSAVLPESTV
jgi:hypothetical protein